MSTMREPQIVIVTTVATSTVIHKLALTKAAGGKSI